MKILEVKSLAIPAVKVIKYQHFSDERGFFTEAYKKSDFQNNVDLNFLKTVDFTQINVSYSKKNVVRGLHFQWNPFVGKLVRTIKGHMIDLFLDIRIGSPHFGKIGGFDMTATFEDTSNQWIWIPVGFAHGGVYLEDTQIEYFCTGEYNPTCEATISPTAEDIDWSLFDSTLQPTVDKIIKGNFLMSEKDRGGGTIESWKLNPNSRNFLF